jgi:hypothetical protein
VEGLLGDRGEARAVWACRGKLSDRQGLHDVGAGEGLGQGGDGIGGDEEVYGVFGVGGDSFRDLLGVFRGIKQEYGSGGVDSQRGIKGIRHRHGRSLSLGRHADESTDARRVREDDFSA